MDGGWRQRLKSPYHKSVNHSDSEAYMLRSNSHITLHEKVCDINIFTQDIQDIHVTGIKAGLSYALKERLYFPFLILTPVQQVAVTQSSPSFREETFVVALGAAAAEEEGIWGFSRILCFGREISCFLSSPRE